MADPDGALDALDLPLDAHLHTDLSPDADVPIDAYAALARTRHVAELAITDHLDFEPGAPSFAYSDYDRRLRTVREAAERWDGRPFIRFGVEITYQRRYEEVIGEHLRDHPYDYVIGSVHLARGHPLASRATATAWTATRTVHAASAWYWAEVTDAIHSGLFDTIGHLDVIKRWLTPLYGPFEYEVNAAVYEPLLVALVESGAALEVNSSGLRGDLPGPFPHPGETYPPPAAVARFRALGGQRVVAGSDAHRVHSFAAALDGAYAAIRAAGYDRLAFRRGAGPVTIELAEAAPAEPTLAASDA
ncbi:MAG: histidinol-phosphatase HisJ family protein [Candidatus Limnocylindrales bacterium]